MRHVSAGLLGLAAGVLLAGGALALRLSQGPVAANMLRPAAEQWLALFVHGGRAHVGGVDLAWYGPAGSLGLQLHDVDLADGAGRPVLKARKVEAGLALASLAGLRPAPGRLAAQDFFAAVSVSPQGRYALGYEASGAPGRRAGSLWAFFDDLTGRPRLGRPLSFLRQLNLERGRLALNEIGGPVSWRGDIRAVRFEKNNRRLAAQVDARIGDAAMSIQGEGAVGLRQALLRASLSNLTPARVFPWVGATRGLSALDAAVQGRGWLSWAADRGVQGADVQLTAGQGRIRLGGAPTPFQSGELSAAFDARSQRVLIEAFRAASAQAAFDLSGQAWLTPESRTSGPARLELALQSGPARLSLAPGVEPAQLQGASLRGRYTPATGQVQIDGVKALVAGVPVTFAGRLQRPRDQRSWGMDLAGRIDGLLPVQDVVALWPDQLSEDVRDWVHRHIRSGRLGRAVFQSHLSAGAIVAHRPIPNDKLRFSFQYEDADITAYASMPVIEHARGSALLQGDRFDMAVQSASIQGVSLGEGTLTVPRLMGDGKRLEVRGRAAGEARTMLEVVDRSSGGVPSAHGFAPSRLGGRGDILFRLGQPLDDGPDRFSADYRGVVRGAMVSDAALGLTLKAASINLEGSLDHLSADGQVELGPYRGPLRYSADFPGSSPMLQHADFDGRLDASSIGVSGPAGSTLPFRARFEARGDGGRGSIRSRAFDGESSWTSGKAGRFLARGVLHAGALRAAGLPVGKGLAENVPARLVLARAGGGWSGQLDADAYSGTIAVVDGPTRRLHYAAQLTPAEAQKLGLQADASAGRAVSLVLDVATTGEAGSASYGVGPWLGQVSWSRTAGARTQYRWRTTLAPADLHALGLPAGIEPSAPLPVEVILASAGGAWSGSAMIGGGAFRFTASPPVRGRRRLNLTGGVDGKLLADLGLGPHGMITGPTAVAAALDLGPEGLRGGHLETDLQRAAVLAPFTPWKKPAGRPMLLSGDFTRGGGEVDLTALRGQGPGFALNATGQWKADAGGALHVANAKLEGAFEGALDLSTDSSGRRIVARARYFDARRLLQQGGQPAAGGPSGQGQGRPLYLDAQLAQVRVSEEGMVRNVRIIGDVGGDRRKLDVGVTRDDGASLVALHLFPDAAGMAISGQVSDVGEAAYALFGKRSFRGGTAVMNGRLVAGGADLHVEMSRVRLSQAPALARILTVGSLHGMADTLNGSGIEFTKVVAPVSIRGARLNIGRARATGPAMGITTQGVIDIDSHTVDLSGGIAPSYVLNSAMGAVPVVGDLLVSHKGEGMFGLTYSARGAFAQPKITVNPFSLATPGILRRIFEGRSAAARAAETGG